MNVHEADGFGLTYTSRTSWKAYRSKAGKRIDIVPVTWSKGLRNVPGTREQLLEVWYRNAEEMERQRTNPTPFIVAMAEPHDRLEIQPRFKSFVGVFEVQSTGVRLTEISIETKVIKRFNPRDK